MLIPHNTIYATLVASLFAAGPAIAAETESSTERETFVEQGKRNLAGASISMSEQKEKLTTDGPRLGPSTGAKSGRSLASADPDFWIFDATTRLFHDFDNDGFFTRLELDFDADTHFFSADVYAELFLSLDGGPWNTYTTTAVFTIFGTSDTDDYFVDTDLVSGYPAGSYDLLIELYNAADGRFVTSFGPSDTPALFDLPLEDQQEDAVVVVEPQVSHSHGGGGTTGWPAALALIMMALVRVTRQHLM